MAQKKMADPTSSVNTSATSSKTAETEKAPIEEFGDGALDRDLS